jgi:hypothetical protein
MDPCQTRRVGNKRKAGKWFAFDELLQHNNKKHIFQKNTANSSKNALLFKKK